MPYGKRGFFEKRRLRQQFREGYAAAEKIAGENETAEWYNIGVEAGENPQVTDPDAAFDEAILVELVEAADEADVDDADEDDANDVEAEYDAWYQETRNRGGDDTVEEEDVNAWSEQGGMNSTRGQDIPF